MFWAAMAVELRKFRDFEAQRVAGKRVPVRLAWD